MTTIDTVTLRDWQNRSLCGWQKILGSCWAASSKLMSYP